MDPRWHSDPIHQQRVRIAARVAPPLIALCGTAFAAETVFPHSANDAVMLSVLFWAGAGASLLIRRLAPPVVRVEGADPSARLVDEESGLGNAHFFRDVVQREFARSTRHRSGASVVLFDVRVVGFLLTFDGEEPPPFGKHVARVVGGVMRESDVAARLGKQRFGVLLAETDVTGARSFAERLSIAFAGKPYARSAGGPGLHVSPVFGAAALSATFTNAAAAVEAAAARLDASSTVARRPALVA